MKEAKLDNEAAGREAKPRTAAASAALAGVSSFSNSTKDFLSDVRAETRRVSWPTMTQIRATTLVVIITVFFFGAYFGVLDWFFNIAIRRLLRLGT